MVKLYDELDEAIAQYPTYLKQKEQRIAKLKLSAVRAANPNALIDAELQIYKQYKSFQKDSALFYINDCIRHAQASRLYGQQAQYQAYLALQYAIIGSYNEALATLQQIDRKHLSQEGLNDYYYAYNQVYQNMALAVASMDKKLMSKYYAIADHYGDTLLQHSSPLSDFAMRRQEVNFAIKRQFSESLKVNDRRLAACQDDQFQFATVAFHRYLIYMAMNDKRNAKIWLLKSAIADTKSAITDQSSLWSLAEMLCDENEIERANRYLHFSFQSLSRFNAPVRFLEVSPVLDKIDTSYQRLLSQNNLRLKTTLVIISLMALVLAVCCYFVYRQKLLANKARNDAMKLNRKLGEANHVKEEYIGQFLTSCSHYIDMIDHQRLDVNKLLRKKQYALLNEMTSSSALRDEALDELYARFDATFLQLYPNFVEQLNTLLREDSQLALPADGRLTPTLRIFALIRLGIDDSNKIAEFLHYAVNTIYNYRAKLKNAAKGDRNTFEQEVRKLGTISQD